MPERSEWLIAEGVAKRNPRYNHARLDAKNANISFLGNRFRVLENHPLNHYTVEIDVITTPLPYINSTDYDKVVAI